MSHITLHDKYGVNPTISQCFWCGKEKNEIALLGRHYEKQAPMHMVLSYEPCDECKQGMAMGITFMEAKDYSNGKQPPMKSGGRDVFPTGVWCVLKPEAVERMISDESLRNAILKEKRTFIEPQVWDKLGFPREGKSHENGKQQTPQQQTPPSST